MTFSIRQTPYGSLFEVDVADILRLRATLLMHGQQCSVYQKFHHFVKMSRNKPSVAKSLPQEAKRKFLPLLITVHQHIQMPSSENGATL